MRSRLRNEHPDQVPAPHPRRAARPDPRRRQHAVRRAWVRGGAGRGHRARRWVTRGLVHDYFGGRKEVYLALLERLGGHFARKGCGHLVAALAPEWRTRYRAGPDWTEANRTYSIWRTIAPGEDVADPDVRRAVTDLVRRAVALVAAFHADSAEDSPRLRYALECWTGLTGPPRDAGCAATPPAMQRRSCWPQLSNTSSARSARHPTGAPLQPTARPDAALG